VKYRTLIVLLITRANNLNNSYASVFSYEWNIPDINSTHSDKPFTIKINIIGKRLAMVGRNKSVGPDGIPGAILKMGGEAMIPYLARLLDITFNNGTIKWTGKRPQLFLFTKEAIVRQSKITGRSV